MPRNQFITTLASLRGSVDMLGMLFDEAVADDINTSTLFYAQAALNVLSALQALARATVSTALMCYFAPFGRVYALVSGQ